LQFSRSGAKSTIQNFKTRNASANHSSISHSHYILIVAFAMTTRFTFTVLVKKLPGSGLTGNSLHFLRTLAFWILNITIQIVAERQTDKDKT